MSVAKKRYERLRADSGQHLRILVISILLGAVAFIPLTARLYQLMVYEHTYYAQMALQNQSRTTQAAAERGIIYDRNMNILACNVGVQTVYLDPQELKQSRADIENISAFLGDVLELDASWIKAQAQDLTMRYKRIRSGVSEETADQIRRFINDHDIRGIHLEPESKRYYPYGTLASQVIGFVNASNVGSEGVEAAYNSYLQGGYGKVVTTKGNNEMDMPYSYENFIPAQPGCSVILTLDATVQACLENQMQQAIDRYAVQNGAFGIVMNVKTGEILAMATLGGYDPNNYLEIQDPVVSQQLAQLQQSLLTLEENSEAYREAQQAYRAYLYEAQLKQWRNRCISDGYEPGSTFKVLTMAAALDSGAIDLETTFYCKGAEQIPGRSQLLHCWRSAGHGSQQTPQALQNSCNLAFAHIALKLGGDTFYEYIKNFGILEKTGIDLAGESKGVFFDKALVTDTDKWGTASLTSGSFGQTFKLTPLQLVRAISAVVNGGYLMEPYIVSEVLDAQGNTVLLQEPTVIRQVIREETSKTMCNLLQSVVEEGTAKNAAVYGYQIGGKTGTSEKIDVFDDNGQRVLDKIVSFVGVAPMDDPEYIVLVALDTPSRETGLYISGGVMAAPTVGAVLADILPYLGVEQVQDPENLRQKLVALPDLTGLTPAEAEKQLKALGLTAVFTGEAETVTQQLPGPGQSVPGDSQVLLYLGTQPELRMETVPDFTMMNRQQASDAAGLLGFYILVSGNTELSPHVKVIAQSIAPGTKAAAGTTIELTFADTRQSD